MDVEFVKKIRTGEMEHHIAHTMMMFTGKFGLPLIKTTNIRTFIGI